MVKIKFNVFAIIVLNIWLWGLMYAAAYQDSVVAGWIAWIIILLGSISAIGDMVGGYTAWINRRKQYGMSVEYYLIMTSLLEAMFLIFVLHWVIGFVYLIVALVYIAHKINMYNLYGDRYC